MKWLADLSSGYKENGKVVPREEICEEGMTFFFNILIYVVLI